MSKSRDPGPLVQYRCCACGLEFVPAVPGVAPCPRCQAIGGHEQTATVRPRGGRDVD